MKKLMVWFFALMMVVPSLAAAVMYPEGRPLKIGHRGARALSDENTLESLKMAVDLGVDMLEFDIHRTSDGVFVLMHDETVDRTTDGTGRVDEMTAEEFSKLKTERGYTPPTFEAVLEWLGTNTVSFTIDCKITDPEVAKQLIALVESHGLLDRAVFESPDPKVAAMIEEMRPELVTAIYPTDQILMRYYLQRYNIDIASYQYAFANPIEIALAQAAGKKVLVWTVDQPALIKWFTSLKVDGIMTDDPNLFENQE